MRRITTEIVPLRRRRRIGRGGVAKNNDGNSPIEAAQAHR